MMIRYVCSRCRVTVQDLHYTREGEPPASITCPNCGEKSPREVIGSSSFVLTGPGWTEKGGR